MRINVLAHETLPVCEAMIVSVDPIDLPVTFQFEEPQIVPEIESPEI